jgi:hypothetical protein
MPFLIEPSISIQRGYLYGKSALGISLAGDALENADVFLGLSG